MHAGGTWISETSAGDMHADRKSPSVMLHHRLYRWTIDDVSSAPSTVQHEAKRSRIQPLPSCVVDVLWHRCSLPAAMPPINSVPICITLYVSCLTEHFGVRALLRSLWEQRFVFMLFCESAMLVQSGPRQRSSRQLNLVLHFHVTHSCSWYTIMRTFMSIVCKYMWTHSAHAFAEHPLSQSATACLWLGPVLFLWQLFLWTTISFLFGHVNLGYARICASRLQTVNWRKSFGIWN